MRKIKEMNDWVQDKVEKGRIWMARPKIWLARGRASEPAFSNRYYISAVTRDDAIAVLNRLDPGYRIEDLYVTEEYPSDSNYEAYKTAQEDLIRQQNAERAQRQAAQDENIDISNLKGYRVSNSTTYMYVVAENGGEAAEIASKMDPERFPNIADITVQDAGSIGADTLIRGMYTRQQAALGNQQQSPNTESNKKEFVVVNGSLGERVSLEAIDSATALSQALLNNPGWDSYRHQIRVLSASPQAEEPAASSPSNTRISDIRTYTVTNNETGQARRFAATSQEDAINIGRREYPALFNILNVTATQSS
jgi:hypothetical protein